MNPAQKIHGLLIGAPMRSPLDPLCSVLDPLIKALNQTYDELRARINIAFSEAKTALKSDSIQI